MTKTVSENNSKEQESAQNKEPDYHQPIKDQRPFQDQAIFIISDFPPELQGNYPGG